MEIISLEKVLKQYFSSDYSLASMDSPQHQKIFVHKILSKYASSDMYILDAGTGIGRNVEVVKSLMQERVNLVGVDVSSLAVKRGHKKNPEYSFCLNSITHLPFADETFDIVICTEVLEHVPAGFKAAKELNRVLKTDGVLFVSTPNYLNLTGLVKRIKDQSIGSASWDPWGAHIYEAFMTSTKLMQFIRSANLKIISTFAADYITGWLLFLTRRSNISQSPIKKNSYFILRHHIRYLLIFSLGKMPFIKLFGMHFYLIAKKL